MADSGLSVTQNCPECGVMLWGTTSCKECGAKIGRKFTTSRKSSTRRKGRLTCRHPGCTKAPRKGSDLCKSCAKKHHHPKHKTQTIIRKNQGFEPGKSPKKKKRGKKPEK
jgi:hypothetical protein